MCFYRVRTRAVLIGECLYGVSGVGFMHPCVIKWCAALVVEETDTVVEPWTEVVHFEDATAEHPAIVRPVWLVHVWFALAADTPRAILFCLKRLQLWEEGAYLAVLGTDDPRVGDATRLCKHRACHANQPQGEQHVECDAVANTEGMRLWVVNVLHHGEDDVVHVDKIAPRHEAGNKENWQPSPGWTARTHVPAGHSFPGAGEGQESDTPKWQGRERGKEDRIA